MLRMHLGVIAAGDGLRLKEEWVREPKPLVKVLGKTLLERVLIIAKKYKFDSCSLIINEKFRDEIEKTEILQSFKNITLNYIFKSTPSSLHSLNELTPFLSEDSFCLMTIDSIFAESEFAGFIESARDEKSADGLIAVTDFVDDEKPLWVSIDRDDRIQGFKSSQEEGIDYVTGGIYFFREGIIGHTDTALSKNIFRLRNFLQYLIEEGKQLRAFIFSKIVDIDHNKDIAEAEKFLIQTEKNYIYD